MACANVETLSVSSTLAILIMVIEKNDNIADKTYNACSWTVWPTATQRFKQSYGQSRLSSWDFCSGKMLMLPKAHREWRRGGLDTEAYFFLYGEVNVLH